MATGSFNRPWVDLEPNRPQAVKDIYDYWADPPTQLSDRCHYWIRQIRDRGWLPNKHLRRECRDCQAEWFGVYLYEYLNVLQPLIDRIREDDGSRTVPPPTESG